MIDRLLDLLTSQATNNFFSGGLALGVLGGLTAAVAKLVPLARRLAAAKLLTTVSVSGRDPLFGYVVAWLNHHPYSRRCRNLAASVPQEGAGAKKSRDLFLVPGVGGHLLFHRGVPIWLERKEGKAPEANEPRLRPGMSEIFQLTTVGPNQAFLRNVLAEIAEQYGERDPNRTVILRGDDFADWTEAARIRRRHLASIVFPDGAAEEIVADARAFLANEAWYGERGIPWRRGYLLHGTPGTGKTSLIRAVAGELDLDIAMVSVSSGRIDDQSLSSLLGGAPTNAILVIEDVDAIFSERNAGDNAGQVTFSGLLNAIDGVLAQEGHLLFMTTNHIERLDPALIRPGRVDVMVETKALDTDGARRMFLRFFPDEDDLADSFARTATGRTPAEAQAHLLLHSGDPATAASSLRQSGEPPHLSRGGKSWNEFFAGTRVSDDFGR